jgi:protein-S-isoprenylcysteine O-methyltransferase Ste14
VRTKALQSYSRNPLYVAVLAILAGWAMGFRSWPLCGYAALVAVAFHRRIVSYEEPVLKAAHTRQWADYAANVPRWLL